MYGIRQNASELKRQDILLNKTREEIAKYYVTKDELLNNMDAVMDRLEKLDEKIDKLFELKYK
jgi:archaellum component FlaC